MYKQNTKTKRIHYLILFVILLAIEICIALFVHDTFIRPYIGDVLVVIVIYAAVRMFVPVGLKLLPAYIFVFAVLVEVMQYFKLIEVLGIADITFLRVLVGSVFDIKDIGCYGVGCIFLGIYEWMKK